jgi:hypothetical protein
VKLSLDEMRAARAEKAADADPHEFEFAGKTFVLPRELPFELSELWGRGNIRGGLDLLFDGRAAEFWEENPTVEDVTELVKWIGAEYGLNVGE